MIMKNNSLYQKIYDLIEVIPPGKVATYGQVARYAGMPRDARRVAYALHVLPEGKRIPWHRVINREGKISYAISRNGSDNLQRALLEEEGVVFNPHDAIDLQCYQYNFE
jgi:methylated-DNA-protein-cysteine methyltransferase-like protein